MKTIRFFSPTSLLAGLFLFIIQACKDDAIEVPMASTQANFDYEVTVIVIDEEEEIEHYQVKLYNRSLLAQSFLWDFGNGLTSTDENPTVIYTSAGKYTISLTVTPTNEVYYNVLTKTASFAFGKQVLLFEDFNEGIEFIDEDSWAPEGWKAIDNDGDGYNWYVGVRQGVVSMRSQSWDGSPLEPDNWLITPEIDLTTYDSDATVTFRYGAGITATTPQYKQEHYGIFVAIGNDDLESFELVFEETFSTETTNWISQEREIDLSAYAGNIVFIAIRHFNVTDMDRIFIDEVELYVIE
jgi:PKD repeat protein